MARKRNGNKVNVEIARKMVSDQAERMIEAAMTQITRGFEAELQRTLDDWAERYPRHTFKAYQVHGMLSVDIDPPIGNQSDISYLGGAYRRGAIKVLMKEVDSLIDWHCALEWKIATYESAKPFVSRKSK